MIKNIFLFLLSLIPMCLGAQTIGEWKLYPVFGNNLQDIIDTGSKVYFLSDDYLYSYDKNGDEVTSYSKQTNLTDIRIDAIYYNYDKKYLVVAYKNGNIDVIDDNDKVVNIPDIYDSSLKVSKTINDVCFHDGKIYVATDFGYVVLDENKYETIESHIYNEEVLSIGVVGNNILISTRSRLYLGDISKRYETLADFKSTSVGEQGSIIPMTDNSFVYITGWLYKGIIEGNDVRLTTTLIPSSAYSFKRSLNGFSCYTGEGNLETFDAQGKSTGKVGLPANFHNSMFSSWETDGSYWVASNKGVAHIKVGADGAETILTEFFRPNASSVKIPYFLRYNKAQNLLYVWNTGTNVFYSNTQVEGAVCTYDGSFWKNITPESAPTTNPNHNNNKLNSPYSPVFDPDDPNTYYVGTWYDGAYKITDGKVVKKYDSKNSPLVGALDGYYCNVNQIAFDKDKNMWFIQPDNPSPIMVLPRAKQAQESLSASDWITMKIDGMKATKMMQFLITSKNTKLYTSGDYKDPLIVFDDKGNPAGNVTSKIYSTLTDQDGKEFSWQNIYCFKEDLNGKVWMGTNVGVVELNPSNALNASFTINHLKVPRNDGTNYADYLLNETPVTCIAVDGSNRKWLGTSTSGIFLVSADGSKILNQFTTENSSLTSNKIISVICNPNNNSVYVGTEDGLLEYLSDSAPSAESYNEVYAYPNPVRPDYTGPITIKGLMDNSLVKIADASGNVFKSLRSNGGMATWDGCNANGERVKSGVYYVLSSQNENGSSSGVVTKILVIR